MVDILLYSVLDVSLVIIWILVIRFQYLKEVKKRLEIVLEKRKEQYNDIKNYYS